MRRRGFSIAEMLAAVMVVAIASLVFIGHSSSVDDGIRLEVAVSEVAHALRFARSEALRTNAYYGARIDSTAQRIRVYRLDTSVSPPVEENDVYHPVDKKLYDFALANSSFTRESSITGVAFRFGGDLTPYESVAFDAQGTPMSPVDLALMDDGRIDLSFRGRVASVTLTPLTGRVSIQ
jgi:prepilin-type N-terminal cleavage/methylation domain-containing protein